MPSYNSVNGEPSHGSAVALLRDDPGFDGHVVSDRNGIRHLHEARGTAVDHADSVRAPPLGGPAGPRSTGPRDGTPVVGVLVTGRPLTVDWTADDVPALLLAYFPGTERSRGRRTLFGDNDPSGRLPVTVPKSADDHLVHPHPIGDDEHPDSYDPLYPFGHG